jgi:predicted Zn-dependent protease
MRYLPAALLLLTLSCATNPVTGRRELSLVSESQEIAMGQSLLAGTQQETGFYADPALTQYVAALGQRMAKASERPDLPWEFHVVDDPAVNAFAAPGGFIFITRGIMAYLNSEAELAGVMGHEIGHVTAKHSVSQLSKQQLFGVGLLAGAIAAPEIANSGIGQAAQAGAGLLFLKFGRDDERQADELGHRYSLQQRYDVREMPKTFATLQRMSEASTSSSRVPGFLSTHPDPGDRVAATQRWADTVSSYANLDAGRDRYLDHLEGLVFGNDPRQGYFDGERYLHPLLKFQFTMPTGWQGVNQATRVIAVEPNGKAQMELSQMSFPTARAAADSFARQQGLQLLGRDNNRVGGLTASTVSFRATTSDGTSLTGQATFVELGGAVYRLLGLTLTQTVAQHGTALAQTISSFGPTAANQVFQRVRELHVITLTAGKTVDRLAQESNGAATATELALINSAEVGTMLPAGLKLKTIRFR